MKAPPRSKSSRKISGGALIVLLLGISGTSYGAYSFAKTSVAEIERATLSMADASLQAHEFGWIRTAADGLILRLYGKAPSEEARLRAQETVANFINVRRIDNQIIVEEVVIDAPVFQLELIKNKRVASAIGILPDDILLTKLRDQINRLGITRETLDIIQTIPYESEGDWGNKIDFAERALLRLDTAKITVNENTVIVETIAADANARDELERDLRGLAPAGMRLSLNISAPRPLIAPFVFSAEHDDGKLNVSACSASGISERNQILRAAQSQNVNEFDCNIGLGAPTENWGVLIDGLVKTISPLSFANLDVVDNQISLTTRSNDDPQIIDNVESEIRLLLPPGFGFQNNIEQIMLSVDEMTARGDRAQLTLTKTRDGVVTIKGVTPNDTVNASIESIAAAKFGTENLSFDFSNVDGLPAGWERAALAAIDAISQLKNGRAIITEASIGVSGTAPSHLAYAQVKTALASLSEVGFAVTDEIEVAILPESTLIADANAIIFGELPDELIGETDPQTCLASIHRILEGRQINFEPNSTKLDATSVIVVEDISKIMALCPQSIFEIAGYTDSSGRDEVNLQLSQERADAVRNQFIAIDSKFQSIVATGFGESSPVADNDTTEGRARNRRIEFHILGDDAHEPAPTTEGENN